MRLEDVGHEAEEVVEDIDKDRQQLAPVEVGAEQQRQRHQHQQPGQDENKEQ